MKRKHGGGGQETRTGGTTPLGTRRDQARGRGWKGGGSGYRNGGGRTQPRRENPQGLTGALATSREAKGGRQDGGRGGENGLAAEGCRGRYGPGEQV